MSPIFKRFGDSIGFAINPDTCEIALLIGTPILSHLIGSIPEQSIKNTAYNRQVVKWFKYEGIAPGTREINFSCRLRIMKFTDKIWPGRGTWCTYDNAWDVRAGLNLEVQDRKIRGNVRVKDTNSDWPSGLGGIFISAIDAISGLGSWMLGGDFYTLSDFIGRMAGAWFNSSEYSSINGLLSELNELNNRHLIYLSRVEYESQWVGYWFQAEGRSIDEVLSRLKNYFITQGWM